MENTEIKIENVIDPVERIILDGYDHESLTIVGSKLKSIYIKNSNIRIFRIANCEVEFIRIENCQGINWSFAIDKATDLILENSVCQGDIHISVWCDARLRLKKCSAGDHFILHYASSNTQSTWIEDCDNIYIKATNILVLGGLSILNSDFSIEFNNVNFVGAFEVKESEIGKVFINHDSDNKFSNLLEVFEEPKKDYGLNINNCIFNADIIFNNCKVHGPISIKSSSILGSIDFGNSSFFNIVYFNLTKFKRASFRHTEFRAVNFQDAEFTGPADFSYCKFKTPPQFMGASLYQGTTFHEAHFFFQRKFKKVNADQSSAQRYLSSLIAFRVLKVHMGKIRSHIDESMFFALEMQTERRLISWKKHPVTKLLSFAYDFVSEYGFSPGRSLFALGLWNSIFFGLFIVLGEIYDLSIKASFPFYFGVEASRIAVVDLSLGGNNALLQNSPIAALVLQNAFNPIALISSKSIVSTNSWWIFSLSVVQSIGVIAIATLFILAIRSRFQKGSGGGDK